MTLKASFTDCYIALPWRIAVSVSSKLDRIRPHLSRKASLTALALGCLVCEGALGATEDVSAEPGALVRFSIDQLRTYHINRAKIDWVAAEATAMQKAKDAASVLDAYAAIDHVISELNEPHSFLVRPTQHIAPSGVDAGFKPKAPVIKKALLTDIGYLDLPTFAGSGDAAISFASEIRATMLNLEKAPLCGWIIDLRSNEGGNMHAALLGLGAILGNGRLGSALGGPVPQVWHYRKNEIVVSTTADVAETPAEETSATSKEPVTRTIRQLIALPADSKEVLTPKLPVAILLGRFTKSSGEGIAISFIGRPAVKTFGSSTAGWATANIALRLGGGELLVITYGRFADRNGVEHAPAVEPDVDVPSGALLSTADPNDPAVSTASHWIHQSNECPADKRRE